MNWIDARTPCTVASNGMGFRSLRTPQRAIYYGHARASVLRRVIRS